MGECPLVVVRVVVTLSGNCPGGSCLGGTYPRWYLPYAVVTLGGNCPGVVVRVVVVLGGSYPRW